MLWIIEVEMVDSLDELQSSRSVCGKNFPNFEMLDAKIAFASSKITMNSQVQEEGQSRGTESPQRGPVSTRKTDRLHDPRLLSSDWCSWHSFGLCWLILCYSWWRVYSGIRYKMSWSCVIYVQDSIRWHLGKSVQIEGTWVGDSSEDTGSQLSKVENNGEEEYRSETSITKLWRHACMGELN